MKKCKVLTQGTNRANEFANWPCHTEIGCRNRDCLARQFTKVNWSEFRMLSRCLYASKFVFWKLFYFNSIFQRYTPCECSVCSLTIISPSKLVLILAISNWAFHVASFGIKKFNLKPN